MFVPLSWLSAYVPVAPTLGRLGVRALAHAYSIQVALIEGTESIGCSGVVIARVVSCEAHPDSDHLNVVRVDCGNGDNARTIVCGAENVKTAKYVAVALPGAVLPGDFTIKAAKLRGVESQGMICSVDELGLSSTRYPGILTLETVWNTGELETKIGTDFFSLTLPFTGNTSISLRDEILEIDNKFITNRPDLFGVVGNAREFATLFGEPFADPFIQNQSSLSATKTYPVRVESDAVLAYTALHIENIAVKPTHELANSVSLLLARSGVNPKFDIVDITNFVSFEYGQPMHAFDADKIEGGIVVRKAKQGETLLALDGKTYTFSEEDTVIADTKKVLAVAGIIGGQDSAVGPETTNIVFEIATFDAVAVRLTSQRLGIRTDASTRYEKSLDPLMPERVIPRVLELMAFLGQPNTVSAASSFVQKSRIQDITITTSLSELSTKIGRTVELPDVLRILTGLGFGVTQTGESLQVRVPSWRATKDVSIWEDLAEEVGRHLGYDTIEAVPIDGPHMLVSENAERTIRRRIGEHLSALGWLEAYNYSFSNETLDHKTNLDNLPKAIRIENAFSEDFSHLRRSLAPRLFEALVNHSRTRGDVAFFEMGSVFSRVQKNGQEDFTQETFLAGALVCPSLDTLRGILDGLSLALFGHEGTIQNTTQTLPFLHPGKSGIYTLSNTPVFTLGRIHPQVAKAFELSQDALYFEADFPTLIRLASLHRATTYTPISRFPSIARELNFVLEARTTPIGDIATSLA